MRKINNMIASLIATINTIAAARGDVEKTATTAEAWVRTRAEAIVGVPIAYIRFLTGIMLVGVKLAEALLSLKTLNEEFEKAFEFLKPQTSATKVVEKVPPVRLRKERKDKGQKRRKPFIPTTTISTVNAAPRSTSPANPLCVAGDCLGCDKAGTCSTKGARL